MTTLLLALLLAPAPPGEVIDLYVTATYEDAYGRTHEAYPAHVSLVVVNADLQQQLAAHGVRAVYAPGAVRRWESAPGQWQTWRDPCLPGIREVRIVGRRSVEGIATTDGDLFVVDKPDVSEVAETSRGGFSAILGPFTREPTPIIDEVLR